MNKNRIAKEILTSFNLIHISMNPKILISDWREADQDYSVVKMIVRKLTVAYSLK